MRVPLSAKRDSSPLKTFFEGVLLVGLLLFLSSCQKNIFSGGDSSLLALPAETDCGFVQNTYGQRVSWKQNLPVVLILDQSWPKEFVDTVRRATDKWNSTFGKKFFTLVDETSVAHPSAQDLKNILFWRADWSSEKSFQQAVTTLFYKGVLINESDIRVNAKDFLFFSTSPNSNQEIHLESLLLHEFGHVLGLKHSTEWPTIMWATLSSNTIRDTITSHDQESIRCEYLP